MEETKAVKADPAEIGADEIQPTEYDVLFGRGKPFQDHPGNLRLHSIVNVYKPNYTQARRHEKTAIAEDVVKIIKNDGKHVGRFLKQVDGKWEGVSDIEARAKVSHALRGKSRVEPKSKSAISKSQMQPNLGLNQVGGLDSMRQPNPLHSLVSQQPNMMVAPFASVLSQSSGFMPSGMPSMYQSMLLNNIREERDRLILQQLAAGAMNPLQMRQPQGNPGFPNASRLLESLRANPSEQNRAPGGTRAGQGPAFNVGPGGTHAGQGPASNQG
ncbi:unnamed protein product [Cylindrotheca closterium]|uniref:DUF6824 domain-containing protein n=1 Tax=Cylindrotheca closterium TaxID=2856 RepID=A0AAD2FCD5_9STRA|nr:unnamed protein product [Cylindrotheca closterium]